MNITYATDSIYPYHKGGKEKRLYELSTRLARMGHDVHVYTMHWWDGPEKTRIENGITLHAISKLYPLYKGDKRSITEGIMFGLACLKLMRINFDILDVDHMPFFPVYSARIVCLLRRKKLYGTWHESLSRKDWTDYMGAPGIIAYGIEHLSIQLPRYITSSSRHTMVSLGIEHGRTKGLSIVSPGIDTALLKKLKPAATNYDVLYVGRLVKGKNIDKLVEAIAEIVQTNKSFRCGIIGHGIEKGRLKKQIASLKLEPYIELLEPLESDIDVYRQMKAAKVFCLPSTREGFGMVVLEALGCGTPVITIETPANNSRHLIEEGVNGSRIDLSSRDLAICIQKWISTPKPNSIAAKVSRYDWDILAADQYKVYSQ